MGVERQGLRFSMSHISEGEWRAYFQEQPDVRAGGVRGGDNAVAGGAASGVASGGAWWTLALLHE